MLSITHYSIITFEYNNTNNERLISFGVLSLQTNKYLQDRRIGVYMMVNGKISLGAPMRPVTVPGGRR